jgi:hypothetical protein
MKNEDYMNIKLQSIYSFNLIQIKLSGAEKFDFKFDNGTIVNIEKGLKTQENLLVAVEDGSIYSIEFEILDWVKEKPISETNLISNKNNPQNYYGMRYYPFISSNIQSNFTIYNGTLNSIVLNTPNDFRLIWYGAKITDLNNNPASINHSYSNDASNYIFLWENAQCSNESSYEMKLPIRMSGEKILKLVHFPILYWILALFIVSIAAFQDKPSILAAAIAGSWTFMLRQWTNSNTPQRNSILTFGYTIAGLFLLFWGLVFKFFELKGLFLIIPVLLIYKLINFSIKEYGLKGILPKMITNYWSKKIMEIDNEQKASIN